ncbi:MAG: hypothetical protein AAF411_10955 [Myxococcota bacterium]
MDRTRANAAVYDGSQSRHYESWFLRGNEPGGERAFWIRYTNLIAAGAPPMGERWAVFFDGDLITAAYDRVPIERCRFGQRGLDVTIEDAFLRRDAREGVARGSARGTPGEGTDTGPHVIAWDLRYRPRGEAPLLLLEEGRYANRFPAAKALVPEPKVHFEGVLEIDDAPIELDGWIGSQNHNWGSRHTDRYAWGQVAHFDNAADSFLEVSCAQLDLAGGRLRTPWLTPIVLRHEGREYALRSIARAVRNDGHYEERNGELRWTFGGQIRGAAIRGRMWTRRFVDLPYGNTEGGVKRCLNSKVAQCVVDLSTASGHTRLTSQNAAFEILRD